MESGSSVKEILLIRILVCLFCYSYNDSVSFVNNILLSS